MASLGVEKCDLIEGAYMDLMDDGPELGRINR
jgi:hypothetical protein